MRDHNIRVRFIANYAGRPTVMIATNIRGLLDLEDRFGQLYKKEKQSTLSNAFFHDPERINDIVLKISSENKGLERVGNTKFEWGLTKSKWNEFREKVSALIKNKSEGELFLNIDNNKLENYQVVIYLNLQD